MATQGTVHRSEADAWALQTRIGTRDARYDLAAPLAPSPAGATTYLSGVMAAGEVETEQGATHTGLRVTANSDMSVTVTPGNAVVDTPNNGPYQCALPSEATLSLTASSPTANRMDVIIARVYDDQNAALGSPADERKFTIEVWEGDPVAGTPQEPTPTPGEGWIALAAVRIDAGASAPAPAQDRRGFGLAARGGSHTLYGALAQPGHPVYEQPGAYPGQRRWVHTPGVPDQVWYGSNADPARSGWRGVTNTLLYNANPAPGPFLWIRGSGTLRTICSVHIPYPGVPYMVYPTGRLVVQQSPSTAVDVHIKVHDGSTGPVVNWVGDDSGNINADTRHVYNVAPVLYGPFTTPIDVFLTGQVYTTGDPDFGFGYQGGSGENLLSVVVTPSTIPPPPFTTSGGSP